MAHTPGPWRVADRGYGWDHFAAIVTSHGIVANCHIAALSRSHEQTAADARLIAAAPDLLEAVQNLMGLFDNPVVRRRLKDDALYPEVIIQARAAIARAKGE